MRAASIILTAHLVLLSPGCKATEAFFGWFDGSAIPASDQSVARAAAERRIREKQHEALHPHKRGDAKENPPSMLDLWARERRDEAWKQHWRDNPVDNPQMTEAFAEK
jgi:hypothetical protein